MESRRAFPLQYTPVAVFAAATRVAQNPPKGFKQAHIEDALYRIHMKGGMSMLSWGENITIQVYADPSGATLLDITSKPALATTLVDYGKGDRNVVTIANAIFAQLGAPLQAQ